MSNFLEQHPLVFVGGAIAVGLGVRGLLHRRALNSDSSAAAAVYQDQNPWQMQTPNAMDAYNYYTTSTNTPRYIYGTGKDTALVSTDMLARALQTEHDQILAEVHTEIQAMQGSYDQYIAQGGFNPYDAAISQAVSGNRSGQMNYPTGSTNYE